MKNKAEQALRDIFGIFLGRKFLFPFFNLLHYFALRGMNYSNVNFQTNGELYFLKRLRNQYRKEKKTNLVFFDIGANVGDYTQLISKVFSGFDYLVYAFEPSKKTFEILRKNIKENDKVKPINYGLGNTTAKQKLYSPHDHSQLASLHRRKSFEHALEEEINMTTLSQFCLEENINHIDLLKIDVEGNELNLLKGGAAMFSQKKISFVQFEVSETYIDARIYFRDVFHFFVKNDYKVFKLMRDGLYPIKNNYPYRQEILLYTNFIAYP